MPFLTQGKTNWKYILIVIILVTVVGGGILIYTNYFRKEITFLTQFPEIKKPEKIVKDETADWKTYRNEKYGFEIKYPKNWNTREEINQNLDSIKEKYRLDIFHPENITEAKTWGNVAVEYFITEDNKKFYERQLDLMKRSLIMSIEEITINDIKGFKGVEYYEADKGKAMYISQIFFDEEKGGVFRISVWTIDLSNKTYQEQTNLILSTFRFLE